MLPTIRQTTNTDTNLQFQSSSENTGRAVALDDWLNKKFRITIIRPDFGSKWTWTWVGKIAWDRARNGTSRKVSQHIRKSLDESQTNDQGKTALIDPRPAVQLRFKLTCWIAFPDSVGRVMRTVACASAERSHIANFFAWKSSIAKMHLQRAMGLMLIYGHLDV